MFNLIDYKWKHYILQDKDIELSYLDFVIAEIDYEQLTDEYLEEHIKQTSYYGICPYNGENKELHNRIEKITSQLDL